MSEREKVIQWLETSLMLADDVIEKGTLPNNVILDARQYYTDALSLLKAQEPGWISVKDRLPEERINPNTNDFEYVLCATTFGDVRAYKYGMIDGNIEAHFWHGFGMVDKYITHWMPLPEPPKEES